MRRAWRKSWVFELWQRCLPSVMRFAVEDDCFNARMLEHWRGGATLPEAEGKRLVRHLGSGCGRCWAALEALPPLADPKRDVPSPDALLVTSSHPVVRALRIVGGWPPRPWLRPGRRMLLDGAREPFGFLALVVEEARLLAESDPGPDAMKALLRWVNRANELAKTYEDEDSSERRALERILLSGHVALAENQLLRGDCRAAEMSLDWAERKLPSSPGPADLEGPIARVRARLEEPRRLSVAQSLLELAARKIEKAAREDERFGALRIELLLDLAALRLRHGCLAAAERTLDQVSDLLEQADEPLLRYWSCILRARFALARAEQVEHEKPEPLASEPVSEGDLRGVFPELLRLAHQAESAALTAGLAPLSEAIDWRAVRARAMLHDRLFEIFESLTPETLERRLAELRVGIVSKDGAVSKDGVSSKNGHARSDLGLRILLIAAKAVRQPLEGRSVDLAVAAKDIVSLLVDVHRSPRREVFKEALAVARLYLAVSLSTHRTLHELAPLTRYCLFVIDHLLGLLARSSSEAAAQQTTEPGRVC